MKNLTWPLLMLLCAAPAATGARAASAVSPEQATIQLSEILSLVSGGTLGTAAYPLSVVRNGDAFSLRVKLPAFTEPADAALTAHAEPLGNGVWNLTSAAVPPAGVFTLPSQPGIGAGKVAYTLGQQAISARIDPSLSQPSPFQVELQNLTLQSDVGNRASKQTIARETLQGVLSGDADHRLTLRSQTSASGWRITAHDPDGAVHNSSIRSAAGSIEVEGVDRARADRLRAALQAVIDSAQSGGPTTPDLTDLTPKQRAGLAAVLDGLVGIADRVAVEQTIEGFTFGSPDEIAGEIGRMRVGLSGESRNDQLATNIDLTLHDLKVAAVPTEFAAYVPTLLHVRPVVDGIRTSTLLRLLRRAAAGAAPDTLTAEAMALLSQPGARLGIENLLVIAGPLQLEGSGRMLPPSGGVPGLEAHIVARGVDAALATLQNNPEAMKIIPLVFLAKGMARTQGDALVWDVAFADGAITVNGTPLGQAGAARQAPAPSHPPPQKRPRP